MRLTEAAQNAIGNLLVKLGFPFTPLRRELALREVLLERCNVSKYGSFCVGAWGTDTRTHGERITT